MLGVKNLNWNLRNNKGDSALILALKNENKTKHQAIFSVPDLEIDIDLLKKKEVYDAAITACQNIVREKMAESGESRFEMGLEEMLSFTLRNNMDSFSKLLGECNNI